MKSTLLTATLITAMTALAAPSFAQVGVSAEVAYDAEIGDARQTRGVTRTDQSGATLDVQVNERDRGFAGSSLKRLDPKLPGERRG